MILLVPRTWLRIFGEHIIIQCFTNDLTYIWSYNEGHLLLKSWNAFESLIHSSLWGYEFHINGIFDLLSLLFYLHQRMRAFSRSSCFDLTHIFLYIVGKLMTLDMHCTWILLVYLPQVLNFKSLIQYVWWNIICNNLFGLVKSIVTKYFLYSFLKCISETMFIIIENL